MGCVTNWIRYPKYSPKCYYFTTLNDVVKLYREAIPFIPYGNGRSYSDCCLSKNVLLLRSQRYILDFDEKNGIIHCLAGVLLSEIIEFVVPKGWFLKVTPGTKYITVGGAIASDVHGKNHHKDGCFSESVVEFRLLLPSGDIVTCKKGDELFHATCGGMGLTGVIIDAKIQLKKIQSKNLRQQTLKTKNLQETFEVFEKIADIPYSVAWMDCLATGKNMGRSLVMYGDFLNDGDLDYREPKKINIPFDFPSFFLNSVVAKVFNSFYYNKVKRKEESRVVSIDEFFYPLDAILNWNRLYGKNGFLQYQFILPKDRSYEGLEQILWLINKEGKIPFLGVLKLYGKENQNYLSFPLEGYSLALDFKIESGIFELLERLDRVVVKYGGRIYLAKDVRMGREVFEFGYPLVENFRNIRKKYDLKGKIESLQSIRLNI